MKIDTNVPLQRQLIFIRLRVTLSRGQYSVVNYFLTLNRSPACQTLSKDWLRSENNDVQCIIFRLGTEMTYISLLLLSPYTKKGFITQG
jgi:hypothetical protein